MQRIASLRHLCHVGVTLGIPCGSGLHDTGGGESDPAETAGTLPGAEGHTPARTRCDPTGVGTPDPGLCLAICAPHGTARHIDPLAPPGRSPSLAVVIP